MITNQNQHNGEKKNYLGSKVRATRKKRNQIPVNMKFGVREKNREIKIKLVIVFKTQLNTQKRN